jgi:crotonobetainyl-CoA:carnitine CoA-transferase CaiB-like acyl-CoA transferase
MAGDSVDVSGADVGTGSGAAALSHLRICDFTGQLAGAGATKFLAAFGAEVIRIEDPTNEGRWDILRGGRPYVDERRGIELGGSFNNHNVEKLGVTLNLRKQSARDALTKLIAVSDVVTENFSAGVMGRLGFGYERLKEIRPDIIYVSNCGFGHSGPYENYKTWGPIVQAISGLTFSSALPDQPSAGWGYSYMDHTGAYYMAIAILMAVHHRQRTGEGQHVDMASTEAAAALNGPALLDYTVNDRPLRREGMPSSNRNQFPAMAPHGIYPAEGEDAWVAIACRDDRDWAAAGTVIGEPWTEDTRFATLDGRIDAQDELDELVGGWTRQRTPHASAELLQAAGVPSSAVQTPQQRVDEDPNTSGWGLWPTVQHPEMGDVRVDGMPVHLSETDWSIERGAPVLGQHNEQVLGGLLGMTGEEIEQMRVEGAI